LQYNGYESACEGDAFILAFHTPKDSASFAIEAQQQLLAAPWPPQLLAHPDAAEVLVTLSGSGMQMSVKESHGSGIAGSKAGTSAFASASKVRLSMMACLE
jgi:hypothetical protein